MRHNNAKAAQLLFADSETNADIRYLSGFVAPDAFLMLVRKGRKIGVINRLEFARAVKDSAFDELLSWEETCDAARKSVTDQSSDLCKIVRHLAAQFSINAFEVPYSFPSGLALELQSAGLEITIGDTPFVPERMTKSDAEIKAVTRANKAAAAGIRAAEQALKQAVISAGNLKLNGKPLTSERLRYLIDVACLENGAIANNTICAGGNQACDPHERGHGPLRANELIIVDVFPRDMKSGYHGDMTRTFLKGRASDSQRALVAAVRLAQLAALDTLKAGVDCATVHKAASDSIKHSGYETHQVNGTWQGFFHSTGHGLGLEIHEQPRLGPKKGTRLKSGMVVTIEPGLYYPGLGGCRIEDVATVMAYGNELLSKYHYKWEIA